MKQEQDWEQYHIEQDQKTIKRIKRCNRKSTIYMICGLCSFGLSGTVLANVGDYLAKIFKNKPEEITIEQIFPNQIIFMLVLIGLFLFLCVFFFFKAMFRWDEAERLSASRSFWIPNEEEIEFINERFDIPFTRYMLKAIYPTETRTLEVGLREITVTSSYGEATCNYIKNGYKQLTNYGTKQLAYYLASKSFPEGFIIYQTKIVPAGSERYTGGVTDIGGTPPPKKSQIKRFARMLSWLAVWLQDVLRLRTSFTMIEDEVVMSPVDNGQLVINKGYSSEKKGLKPL